MTGRARWSIAHEAKGSGSASMAKKQTATAKTPTTPPTFAEWQDAAAAQLAKHGIRASAIRTPAGDIISSKVAHLLKPPSTQRPNMTPAGRCSTAPDGGGGNTNCEANGNLHSRTCGR